MRRLKHAYSELRGNMSSPRRTFVISLGGVLMAAGVVTTHALLLPGVVILSIYSPTAYKWIKQKTDGHPRVESWIDRARNWAISRIHPTK